ncbi:MAG: response regulator transcription factor [Aeoliella sp.]
MSEATTKSKTPRSNPPLRKWRVGVYMTQPLDAEAYAALIEAHAEVRVVQQSITTVGLKRRIEADAIDFVLVDANILGAAGVRQIDKLITEKTLRGALVITDRDKAGDEGSTSNSRKRLVSRNGDIDEMVEFLHSVRYPATERDANFDKSRVFKRRVSRNGQRRSYADSLTKRELQIWKFIGQGMSVSQIAEQLDLSPSTIDSHKSRLMKKLDVHKSLALVRMAFRFGLVDE